MRSSLESVINELKRLKQEGVERVYIGDTTLGDLKRSIDSSGTHKDSENQVLENASKLVTKKPAQPKNSLSELDIK